MTRTNGFCAGYSVNTMLSTADCEMLASAYQLELPEVKDDAWRVLRWVGTELDLLTLLQDRHAWSVGSEYAPYYLAAVRRALHLAS